MLIVKPQIDLTQIKKDWDEWVKQAGDGFDSIGDQGNAAADGLAGVGSAAKKAGDSAARLGRQGTSALNDISDAADRTAVATEGIHLDEVMERAVGHIGDVKDVLEKAGGALLGFNEETTEAIVLTGDLAEKGASLGSAFGPWGAVIGAALGGAIGLFTVAAQKADALEAQLKEAEQAADDLSGKFSTLSGLDLSGAIAEATKLADALEIDPNSVKILQALGLIGQDQLDKLNTKAQDLIDLGNNQTEATKLASLTQKELNRGLITEIDARKKAAFEVERYKKAIAGEKANGNFDTGDLLDYNAELARQEKILAEAIKKEALYQGALEKIGKAQQDAADVAAEHTKETDKNTVAITKNTETISEWLDATYDKAVATRKAISDLGDNLITDMEADAKPANDAADAQDAADVNELNAAIAQQQRLLTAEQDYQVRAIAAEQELADEKQAIRDAELQASTDFYNALVDGALGAAELIANALAGKAVDAYNQYLDAVANGEKRTKEQRKRNRAESEREIGTNLMTDGSSHILMGTAKGFGGDPAGWAEAIAGAAEVAFGATLGGVGARAQSRLGGTEDRASSTPDRASGDSLGGDLSTKDLRPIVINMNSAFPATEREMQQLADKIEGVTGRPR